MTTDLPRIRLATSEDLQAIERDSSPVLQNFFKLMRQGVETMPGVPGEALYDAVTLRALAIKPDIFKSWFEAEYYAFKEGEVPAKTKELLAASVSKINEEDVCLSCAPYHAAAARFEGAAESEIQMAESYSLEKSNFPEPTGTLINFGVKAAFFPKQISDADVQAVKDLGYSDEAIVEIVSTALIAYGLSALNRIFNLKFGQ